MRVSMRVFCRMTNSVLSCVYMISREPNVLLVVLFEEAVGRATFSISSDIQKEKLLTLLVSSVSRHCFIRVDLSNHFLILIGRIIRNINFLPWIQKGKIFKALRNCCSYLTFPVIIKPILWYFIEFFRFLKIIRNFLVNELFLLWVFLDIFIIYESTGPIHLHFLMCNMILDLQGRRKGIQKPDFKCLGVMAMIQMMRVIVVMMTLPFFGLASYGFKHIFI